MKDAIIKAVKLLLISTAVLIGSTIILYLLSVALFSTIFNAIFGDPDRGTYAVNVFIRLCFPVISALVICIPHARNTTTRRAFLNTLGSEQYDRKEDFKKMVRTKEFYIECAVFVVVNMIMFFLKNPPAWIFEQVRKKRTIDKSPLDVVELKYHINGVIVCRESINTRKNYCRR